MWPSNPGEVPSWSFRYIFKVWVSGQQPRTSHASTTEYHHRSSTSRENSIEREPSSAAAATSQNTLHAVKVVCRLRPRLPDESAAAEKSIVQVLNQTEIRITDPLKQLVNRFDFSACYDEQSGQQDIYTGQVHDMVVKIFEGITATIFTFGCTGSGKTHTLQGSAEDPGITPRAVRTIFERVEELKMNRSLIINHGPNQNSQKDYQVTITCFEIWKDKVWDLLVQGGTSSTRDIGKGDLPIREGANGQIFIPHLRHVTIRSIHQFDKLYSQVMKCRSVSSTKLNHTSSRSHAILTIHVHLINSTNEMEDILDLSHLLGKCVLIDLAGSENNKKTGNEHSKERMKESVEINQSLLALRKVVRSLNTGDHRIPYRDSKLTRILSDSLGGSSAGLVICNIAPVASQYRDTINTLTFGSHSRNVENKVAHKALEFLLPSLSLYQHHSKSVPSLAIAQTTSEPIRVPHKLSWARRPSIDALSRLPFPNNTPTKINNKPINQTFQQTLPKSLSVKTRDISGCFSSPASPSPTQFVPVPRNRKISFKPSTSTSTTNVDSTTVHARDISQIPDDELDKRVQEVLRKNFDQIVQSRVDLLLQAKLNDGSLTPGTRSSIRDSSFSSRGGIGIEGVTDSPTTTTTTGRQRSSSMTIKVNDQQVKDGERLEERICNLEQQFVNISNLLHSVSTSERPKSRETKIPRPSIS
ncbi:hypothetical protein H4Q26_015789 [Puccinia striiformis f. sp. tritici PST-130]|nr:hypothetical protein H4Q26_015789 [Puccinia striiformis f. sp. tritici PST-130]